MFPLAFAEDGFFARLDPLVSFVALLLLGAALCFLLGRLSMRRRVREAGRDAVRQSRAVLGGLAGEQVAPFLPDFPCNPADARFVGKPVDFVAFPGAAEGEAIREVLLIEVKTGRARLSERERQIQAAVARGAVRYVVYRVPDPT